MDTNTLLFILLELGLSVLLFLHVRLLLKLKLFWRGKQGRSFEEVVIQLDKRIAALDAITKATEERLGTLDKKSRQAIRGVALTRFNPFPDAGSKQSFALALMNEEYNGLIISSLFARERMSVFAKKVEHGTPVHEITEEETKAMQAALSDIV